VDLAHPQPHDLLHLRDAAEWLPAQPASVPDWVPAALWHAPWVVVRRAPAAAGWVPVGVRGPARHQRWAAFLPQAAVARCLTPPELSQPANWAITYPQAPPLAVQTLARLAPLLARTGLAWGPAGSTAFELATGQPTLGPGSDLDLVLYVPTALAPAAAARLLARLEAAALTRLDVQLQTPRGGVALLEFVRGGQVLVKTTTGPQLWTVHGLWK
jgi:phosphoribosyl-dephospho-CoA transferase